MTQRVDYVELTKNIGWKRSVKSETLSLRGHFIRSGVLCKDCKKYVARVRHSVCTRCYDRRVQKLLKSGGVYVLTRKTEKQIRREFRA